MKLAIFFWKYRAIVYLASWDFLSNHARLLLYIAHDRGGRRRDIAASLLYHLGKVFSKLDISSRGQLHRVLPEDPDPVPPG